MAAPKKATCCSLHTTHVLVIDGHTVSLMAEPGTWIPTCPPCDCRDSVPEWVAAALRSQSARTASSSRVTNRPKRLLVEMELERERADHVATEELAQAAARTAAGTVSALHKTLTEQAKRLCDSQAAYTELEHKAAGLEAELKRTRTMYFMARQEANQAKEDVKRLREQAAEVVPRRHTGSDPRRTVSRAMSRAGSDSGEWLSATPSPVQSSATQSLATPQSPEELSPEFVHQNF